MGEAIRVVEEMQQAARSKGATLMELAVSLDMYAQLVAECYPVSPSAHFGIPITALEEEPTVH